MHNEENKYPLHYQETKQHQYLIHTYKGSIEWGRCIWSFVYTHGHLQIQLSLNSWPQKELTIESFRWSGGPADRLADRSLLWPWLTEIIKHIFGKSQTIEHQCQTFGNWEDRKVLRDFSWVYGRPFMRRTIARSSDLSGKIENGGYFGSRRCESIQKRVQKTISVSWTLNWTKWAEWLAAQVWRARQCLVANEMQAWISVKGGNARKRENHGEHSTHRHLGSRQRAGKMYTVLRQRRGWDPKGEMKSSV